MSALIARRRPALPRQAERARPRVPCAGTGAAGARDGACLSLPGRAECVDMDTNRSGITIHIVDDDDALRTALARLLGAAGYAVAAHASAASFQAALPAARPRRDPARRPHARPVRPAAAGLPGRHPPSAADRVPERRRRHRHERARDQG
ncbi:hypothetical protein LP419_35145 [Massilia sp. H-1]|nr:hypothetical protein LP419_35145 [Massilia sp. H-1]